LLHVGAGPDQVPTAETPVCAHVSTTLEERKYPPLHSNVAVAPCPRATGLYTTAIPLIGSVSVLHVAIAHVGSELLHVPEADVPVCAHVRGIDDERK